MSGSCRNHATTESPPATAGYFQGKAQRLPLFLLRPFTPRPVLRRVGRARPGLPMAARTAPSPVEGQPPVHSVAERTRESGSRSRTSGFPQVRGPAPLSYAGIGYLRRKSREGRTMSVGPVNNGQAFVHQG